MRTVKALVRFPDESTIRIVDHYRLSRVVDHGSGNYTILFASEEIWS